MKLITYSDQPDNYGMDMFVKSCQRFGWDPIVLNAHVQPFSWEIRMRSVRDFCAGCPPDEVILFTDCFDVLILTDPGRMEQEFFNSKQDIIFSAERNLFPNPALASMFPAAPNSYKYLCAGCYIGRAATIAKMMTEMGCDWQHGCADQMEMQLWFLKKQKNAAMDYNCCFFQSFFMAEDVIKIIDGKLFNTETGTHPMVAHFNGIANNTDRIHPYFRALFESES